jgi:hypothetical protein
MMETYGTKTNHRGRARRADKCGDRPVLNDFHLDFHGLVHGFDGHDGIAGGDLGGGEFAGGPLGIIAVVGRVDRTEQTKGNVATGRLVHGPESSVKRRP